MSHPLIYWQSRSNNKKTGDMPQGVVGASREETRESCVGCALLETECYAWHGRTHNFVLGKLAKGLLVDPDRYRIEPALKKRNKQARYVRAGSIGDPARADPEQTTHDFEVVNEHGLGVIAYTHFWREEDALRVDFMASCNSLLEVDEALERGFRATTLLPWDYYETSGPRFESPAGTFGVVCPAQTKEVTCNDCGLCANTHQAAKGVRLIGFLEHGPRARREKRRAAKQLAVVR